VPIGVDEAKLDARARRMVRRLVEAAQRLDQVYLRQVDRGNEALRARLAAEPELRDALVYFDLMKGPWDRTEPAQRPFIGTQPKPAQAGFYPLDLDKGALEAWIAAHPADRAAFQSYFTIIVREGARLRAKPFSEAYRDQLAPAADRLREAASSA